MRAKRVSSLALGCLSRIRAPRPAEISFWRMDKECQVKSFLRKNNNAASLALPCKWHCYSFFKVPSACLQFCTVSMNPIACIRLNSRTDEHLCQTIHSVYCMVRSTRLLPIRNEKLWYALRAWIYIYSEEIGVRSEELRCPLRGRIWI